MTTHPFDNLSLPNDGRFIFTPCPGTKGASLHDSLATLKHAGASAIISMLPNNELTKLHVANLGNATQAQGMQWFQLPIDDDCAPEQDFKTAFANAKKALLALIESKATIVIHCRGGTGRTGLMAAILLLESGYSWTEIKPLIQAVRKKSLQLDVHLNYLKKHYCI